MMHPVICHTGFLNSSQSSYFVSSVQSQLPLAFLTHILESIFYTYSEDREEEKKTLLPLRTFLKVRSCTHHFPHRLLVGIYLTVKVQHSHFMQPCA